jgi:hypothetical protein
MNRQLGSHVRIARLTLTLTLTSSALHCCWAGFEVLSPNTSSSQNFQQIFAAIADSEYNIAWKRGRGAYQSPNRSQNLRFTYSSNGFTAQRRVPKDDADRWQVSLTLTSWGQDTFVRPRDSAHFEAAPHRFLRVTTDEVTYEYTNSPSGMRQTFIIAKKPSRGNLSLNLAVELKGVEMLVNSNENCAAFVGLDGQEVMRYSDLRVWDAQGQPLIGKLLRLGIDQLVIDIDDSAAQYPVTVDPFTTSWGTSGTLNSGDFGFSVAYAGRNLPNLASGYGGIAVGAPQYDDTLPGQGKVFVFAATSTGLTGDAYNPFWSALGGQANAYFGYSVALAYQNFTSHAFYGFKYAGGPPDIAIGSPLESVGPYTANGAVYVWYGSSGWANGGPGAPSNADWAAAGEQSGSAFGLSLASAGIVRSSVGFQSLVVGAPYFNDASAGVEAGKVYVFYGSSSGLPVPVTASWTAIGPSSYAQFGRSVCTSGDVSLNGSDGILVGAPYYPNRNAQGAAFIYLGGPDGLATSPATSLYGTQNGENFGYSVASAYNVYGDRYYDIIIGAPGYTVGGLNSAGAVFMYAGSSTGVLTTPKDCLTFPWQADAEFGFSVAGSVYQADINNDTFGDFIIGVPFYTSVYTQSGYAYVYFGGNGASSGTQGVGITGVNAYAYLGYSVAGLGIVGAAASPQYYGLIIGEPGSQQVWNGTHYSVGLVNVLTYKP